MFTITRMLVPAVSFLVLSAAVPAFAGPPLICHPFETRGGTLLAWDATGAATNWNAPLASYNTARLTDEVGKLLDTDAPVLTRMENLRRATIYAHKDPRLARQLLDAVLSRTSGPQAWFDAGYLIETYKQAVPIRSNRDQPAWAAVDQTINTGGYALVQRAITATGGRNAEMEFAASLMTQGAASAEHRARASAAAATNSALAINLARQ
jgi:hypothetical protein